MASELNVSVEILSFGASVLTALNGLICVLLIFFMNSALGHAEVSTLFTLGILSIMFGSFALVCSVAVLKETRMHKFVHEQFGFLDVLLLRGAFFLLFGLHTFGVNSISRDVEGKIGSDSWLQFWVALTSVLVTLSGGILMGLHFYDRGDRTAMREEMQYPMVEGTAASAMQPQRNRTLSEDSREMHVAEPVRR